MLNTKYYSLLKHFEDHLEKLQDITNNIIVSVRVKICVNVLMFVLVNEIV